MSMNSFFKSTLIIGASVAGLTLSACASGGASGSSRYGSVYDYESGGGACGAPSCGVVVAQPAPAPVYPAPTPAPVYQAPTPAPAYSGPVSCPAGTTPNGDGSCMMSGSVDSGSYTPYSGSTTTSSAPAECPSGTTPNGDGSCMMNDSSSVYTGSSTTSSSSPVYSGSSSSQMADCPSGTVPNGDGSCMMSSDSRPNITIYHDNNTGYQAPPTDYKPPVYQPIRK